MSQPVVVASAPAPFLRRAFDWWLAQVKRALPPTIFFFVGFNLILWTKLLILARGARHRVQWPFPCRDACCQSEFPDVLAVTERIDARKASSWCNGRCKPAEVPEVGTPAEAVGGASARLNSMPCSST
jgi:hypothetical protein